MGYDMEWSQPFHITSTKWIVRVYHIGCFESVPGNPFKKRWSALQMADDSKRIRARIQATPYGDIQSVPSR
ncbi:hypothetical protein CFRS1_v002866 [Colletotrichum fructicola]|nr:hypothetical protein CFRS1_v002866 [Colletotrichum fructicola]